jgi:deoxycytidylate deaminase/dephospho-CoA kinase
MVSKKSASKRREPRANSPLVGEHSATEANLRRSNLVIGLTGPFGSGCSTMREVLASGFGARAFKISDDIRNEIERDKKAIPKGQPRWRRVLQEYGDARRREDIAYWVSKVIERIDRADIGGKDIVVDGLRNFYEVQEMRRIYPRFFLVAVCADKDERWSRVREDYSGRFDEFEDDDRRDQNEDFKWGQSVQKCVDDADYVFYNTDHHVVNLNGGESPDSRKIERIFKDRGRDFLPLMRGEGQRRDPMRDEVQIAAAYAQSHSSTCLKRHVGAVITVTRRGQEFPISMGFNENPPGIRTCKSESTCYKDEDMLSKLKARGKRLFCPVCGEFHEGLDEPWVCSKCGTSLKAWFHPNRNMELCTAIHAEERAILSLGDRSAEGGTLYVTTFPCFQCARLILDAGIRNIVYVEAYPVKDTAVFLQKNGIGEIRPFSGFTARAFFRVFPKVN